MDGIMEWAESHLRKELLNAGNCKLYRTDAFFRENWYQGFSYTSICTLIICWLNLVFSYQEIINYKLFTLNFVSRKSKKDLI